MGPFLLAISFLRESVGFMYFLSLFLLTAANGYRWGGLVIFIDCLVFVRLGFMTLFIMGTIYLGEKNDMLIVLSEVLVCLCLLFFFPINLLSLYVFFELSVFPILIMILGYGSQVEKVRSAYYLIVYAALCSTPFLYVYFCGCFYYLTPYFSVVLP